MYRCIIFIVTLLVVPALAFPDASAEDAFSSIRSIRVVMDWSEAQRRMQADEFDVIDTLFHHEKRERIYDFTKPYARIDVPIFSAQTYPEYTTKKISRGLRQGIAP
jgi:hypothetical protein